MKGKTYYVYSDKDEVVRDFVFYGNRTEVLGLDNKLLGVLMVSDETGILYVKKPTEDSDG